MRTITSAILVAAALVVGGCGGGPDPEPAAAARPPVMSGGGRILVDGGTSDQRWALVLVKEDGVFHLQLRESDGSTSGVGDFTHPLTLRESQTWSVLGEDGTDTVAAGPLPEGATAVRVLPAGGEPVDATIEEYEGFPLFFVVVPGDAGITTIVAVADDGTVVEEYNPPNLPSEPPDAPYGV